VSGEREVTLRPVTDADEDFLLAAFASTRAEEMARVPWSQEQKAGFVRMQYNAQSRHYSAEFPAGRHEIICADGRPVGRLYTDRNAERLHVLDITILPEFRNAKVGETVLRRLMREAETTATPVTIWVESFNPSQRFFARLGFEQTKEQGFNQLLSWSPERSA
jgi:ribosomal protein S18 acetylase RimI-like enzyme